MSTGRELSFPLINAPKQGVPKQLRQSLGDHMAWYCPLLSGYRILANWGVQCGCVNRNPRPHHRDFQTDKFAEQEN